MFGIVVLAVYAALMIGVTLIFTRRATNAESFHVADRRIGATSAAMSIAATWIWAPPCIARCETQLGTFFQKEAAPFCVKKGTVTDPRMRSRVRRPRIAASYRGKNH